MSPDQPSVHPDPMVLSGRPEKKSLARPVQELASEHRTKHRILKVWCYVICLFAVISGLAIGMTGEPRGIYVVGGVTFALGLLGTLMAVLTDDRPGSRKDVPT